jgi:hypothetical protein
MLTRVRRLGPSARARLVAGSVGPVLACALAACRPGADTPQGAAERFIDQYYVQIDLAAARQYCSGVALKKITDQQRLIGDQKIDEGTRRPRVSYRLHEERREGDEHVLVYDARFDVEGTDSFTRRLLVTARQKDSGWTVSNFVEFE